MAIEQGMIGYTTTSTGRANVAACGSRKPATANNAIAWGVPSRSGAPFVLDMACGISSWGKVESLKLFGQPLPADWCLDAEGFPTLDPAAAKTMLPTAGARGYGLAFLSSVLAGPLVGEAMPIHKGDNFLKEGSEHFFYAIDLRHFVEPDQFYARLDSASAAIRALAPVDGFDKVRLPGELEWERAERWKKEGIPIHRDHAQKLEEVAGKLKIAVPW
jgi:ureidoglycolate dehydrogenase (NAD+)